MENARPYMKIEQTHKLQQPAQEASLLSLTKSDLWGSQTTISSDWPQTSQ